MFTFETETMTNHENVSYEKEITKPREAASQTCQQQQAPWTLRQREGEPQNTTKCNCHNTSGRKL